MRDGSRLFTVIPLNASLIAFWTALAVTKVRIAQKYRDDVVGLELGDNVLLHDGSLRRRSPRSWPRRRPGTSSPGPAPPRTPGRWRPGGSSAAERRRRGPARHRCWRPSRRCGRPSAANGGKLRAHHHDRRVLASHVLGRQGNAEARHEGSNRGAQKRRARGITLAVETAHQTKAQAPGFRARPGWRRCP